MIKPIARMDIEELDACISDLWVTYYSTPLQGDDNLQDIGLCLQLLGKAQERRKQLRYINQFSHDGTARIQI